MRRISQRGAAKARRAKRPPSGRKVARMELRLTTASKKVIEQAASISGLTPGDLAYAAARRIIDEHERFVLRDEDREVFFRAVMNPPKPNARLIRAVKRYRATLA